MKKISYLIAILFFSVLFIFGCSSSDDSSSSDNDVNTAAEDEIVFVVSSVFESLDTIADSSAAAAAESVSVMFSTSAGCISTSPDPVDFEAPFTVTYSSCDLEESGVLASGTLSFAGTVSGSNITITISGTANIIGGGATISKMIFDLSVVAPWNSTTGQISGEPTSITGTITADGTSHNAANITWGDGDDIPAITDPHFVVAGQVDSSSLVIFSKDGSAWGYPNITEIPSSAVTLNDIACNSASDCVTVGDSGTIFYSSDGITWNLGNSSIGTNIDLMGVSFGANRWVAVGEGPSSSLGTIIYSDNNGITWSATNVAGVTYGLQDVAYGDGGGATNWVALSPSGKSWMSVDGISWTMEDLASLYTDQGWMNSISFGNNTWVAVGDLGCIYYANDPSSVGNWTRTTYSGSLNLSGVAYGNANFIAVGQGVGSFGSTAAVLIVSGDNGQNWVEKSLPSSFTDVNRPLTDVAYGEVRWSALGSWGDHLISSDDGNTWETIALDKYGARAIAHRP